MSQSILTPTSSAECPDCEDLHHIQSAAGIASPIACSELVICTRNRAAELERCLASVAQQSVSALTVLVVDSSDGDETRAVVEHAAAMAPAGQVVCYMRTASGLTLQRNVAIDRLAPATEFVHFVDDDTVLDPGYVAAIEKVFREDGAGQIAGVGGLIQNLPRHEVKLVEQLFLLDSMREGVVLPSGMNILTFRSCRPTPADWLSGCSMSFRRSTFAEFRFNPQMRGYSLGEDVDFTFRVSRRYRLLVTPEARIWHFSAPSGRYEPVTYYRRRIHFLYGLVHNNPGYLRMRAFLWSAVGRILINTYLSLRYRRRSALPCAFGTLLGLWDVVRGQVVT